MVKIPTNIWKQDTTNPHGKNMYVSSSNINHLIDIETIVFMKLVLKTSHVIVVENRQKLLHIW